MKLLVVTQCLHSETFRIDDLKEGMVVRGFEVTVLPGLQNRVSSWWYGGDRPLVGYAADSCDTCFRQAG